MADAAALERCLPPAEMAAMFQALRRRRVVTPPCDRHWPALGAFVVVLSVVAASCADHTTSGPIGGGGGGGGAVASRQYRAIGGVSMGAYGAMNLGTKRDDLFGTIGALGGPVDMQELLHHMYDDNLEVKPQPTIPREVGQDFTFDHLPPYPDRATRMRMAQDLFLAFGNPFLHHPDPVRAYLASDSEPARIRRDDVFGAFALPPGPRGFLDGGDANEDGLRQVGESPDFWVDVMLAARGSLPAIAGQSGTVIGERELLDLNADQVYDVGDGIVRNYSEPFTDTNDNLVFEPDRNETFQDTGLDGVPGTGDFGEGNNTFDYDPDRAHWMAQDPLQRLAGRSGDRIRQQRIYMDVGTRDQFEFARHYHNLVAVLRDKGIEVREQEGFTGGCTDVPEPQDQFLLVRYDGEHIGIPDADAINDNLRNGDFCGNLTIWRRLLWWIGFVDRSFPNGDYGAGGPRVFGDVLTREIESPALTPKGAPTVRRTIVVYRPPAFFNTTRSFPIVYFLGGYGQDPQDYERLGLLLDLLIASKDVQNAYWVFLPGAGGRKGSFYVDHVVPHDQVPDLPDPRTTGRYEASIVEDLIPAVESTILNGRVKR